MIVTKATQDAIMHLIGECFRANRHMDRLVSVLGVKFAYNNTAGLLHEHVAHYFPALSDLIGEKCLERYNIPVYYEATPAGGQDYASVEEAIKDFESLAIDFQTMFMGVCKIAFENNDLHVYANLLSLLRGVNYIVEQGILLSDKIDVYGTNPSFDAHIKEHFWIIPEDILIAENEEDDD